MEKKNIRLTAPEISSLWTQYMFDTMAICFIKYALNHIEDEDIREIYKSSLELSERHIKKIKGFFTEEKFPIPQGFTEKDVNVSAPRLFQDPFYLYYLYIMSLQGLTGYSLSVSTSIRSDFRQYNMDCNSEAMILFDKIMDTMLNKGIFTRPAVVSPADTVDFVKHQSFLTGWVGQRRPLTVMEIGDITFNLNKLHLHVALKVAFSQVVSSDRVRKFINKGIQITNKQIGIFETIFREEKLNAPMSWQSAVTNSTISPFSDKLMMYHVQLSTQVAVAFYGTAFSVTSRRDIAAQYVAHTAELAAYAEDGAKLMIDKGWLEEPPKATDRRTLAKGKENRFT